jgi:hypothetical protein
MNRLCYEIKTSSADFLCEMKHPLKRRIGQRDSNELSTSSRQPPQALARSTNEGRLDGEDGFAAHGQYRSSF